jgi:phosphohistidine phosphatase
LKLAPSTIIKAIYDAGETTLMRIINDLPADQDFIALVGHNPAVEQILYTLSGTIKEVPPGTVALIEFNLDTWEEIYEDSGKLTYYDNPKL